jgi:hypothetical protein
MPFLFWAGVVALSLPLFLLLRGRKSTGVAQTVF